MALTQLLGRVPEWEARFLLKLILCNLNLYDICMLLFKVVSKYKRSTNTDEPKSLSLL